MGEQHGRILRAYDERTQIIDWSFGLRVVLLAARSLMLIGWTEKKSLLTQAQRARSSQSFHSLV